MCLDMKALPSITMLHLQVDLNFHHSLGYFSRRQNDDIFLIFPREQDLKFLANSPLEVLMPSRTRYQPKLGHEFWFI